MQFKGLASASVTRAIAYATVLAYFAAPALAEEVKAGDLVITQAWSRATPGGYHLMLLDLKSPLKLGDTVPVTLEFEKAGKVKLTFDVQGVGAKGPGAAANTGGPKDMKKMPGHSGMKM